MIWTVLATWFGSGLSPKAPGTCGTLASLPFGWLLIAYMGLEGLLLASVVIFFVGWFVSNKYMDQAGKGHDPGEIVIDEVAGQWLALLPVAYFFGQSDTIGFVVAFVLFRAFDILKPWPIGWLDQKVGGGLGVMLDDVIAGVFAALPLFALYLFFL